MAALPQDNTARYFVDYSCGGVDHTFVIRFNGITSPASIGTAIHAILSAIDSLLYLVTIVGVRHAVSGSNVSNSVVTGIEGNTYGTGAPTGGQIPNYLRFQGRTTGGHKVSFDLYTINAGDSSFRITSAENGDVAATVGLLNGTSGIFLGIDGNKPVWKSYVNIKESSYWVKHLRSG